MKTMKKVLACMLLVAMLVSMFSMGTMAAANGTVSIEGGTVINDSYSFYKIFELDEEASDLTEGSMKLLYKRSAKWAGFSASDYFTLSPEGYVAWKNGATDAAAFAALAAKYAADNSIDPDSTNHKVTASGATLSVSLAPGYYLMTAVSGSGDARTPGVVEVISDATSNVNAKDSNIVGLPTITKQVSEDNSLWDSTCDAAMGETVDFQVVIAAKAAGKNYVLTDTLSAGFTLLSDTIKVSRGEKEIAPGTDTYALQSTANTFTITFAQSFLNTLADGDEITITYSAILNTNAVVGSTGNPNHVVLSFTDEDGSDSRDASTITYTYGIGIKKVDPTKTVLQGAVFTLKLGEDVISVVPVETDKDGRVTTYRLAQSGDTNTTTEIVAGNITIIGLDAGNYTVTETTAPAGYIKDTEPKPVVLPGTGGEMIVTVEVVNTTGIDLPETGGIGTTIFYILGAVLLIGAAVVLVTRRRMASEK